METAQRVTVTRPVADGERNNWLGRAAEPGERFTIFAGATYGSCDEEAGIVLTESDDPAQGPYFEFPRDAVRGEG